MKVLINAKGELFCGYEAVPGLRHQMRSVFKKPTRQLPVAAITYATDAEAVDEADRMLARGYQGVQVAELVLR